VLYEFFKAEETGEEVMVVDELQKKGLRQAFFVESDIVTVPHGRPNSCLGRGGRDETFRKV
jgi:hypothetical protein